MLLVEVTSHAPLLQHYCMARTACCRLLQGQRLTQAWYMISQSYTRLTSKWWKWYSSHGIASILWWYAVGEQTIHHYVWRVASLHSSSSRHSIHNKCDQQTLWEGVRMIYSSTKHSSCAVELHLMFNGKPLFWVESNSAYPGLCGEGLKESKQVILLLFIFYRLKSKWKSWLKYLPCCSWNEGKKLLLWQGEDFSLIFSIFVASIVFLVWADKLRGCDQSCISSLEKLNTLTHLQSVSNVDIESIFSLGDLSIVKQS